MNTLNTPLIIIIIGYGLALQFFTGGLILYLASIRLDSSLAKIKDDDSPKAQRLDVIIETINSIMYLCGRAGCIFAGITTLLLAIIWLPSLLH